MTSKKRMNRSVQLAEKIIPKDGGAMSTRAPA